MHKSGLWFVRVFAALNHGMNCVHDPGKGLYLRFVLKRRRPSLRGRHRIRTRPNRCPTANAPSWASIFGFGCPSLPEIPFARLLAIVFVVSRAPRRPLVKADGRWSALSFRRRLNGFRALAALQSFVGFSSAGAGRHAACVRQPQHPGFRPIRAFCQVWPTGLVLGSVNCPSDLDR